eukprot:jgi/Ulvmu1/1023/UM104_0008.1
MLLWRCTCTGNFPAASPAPGPAACPAERHVRRSGMSGGAACAVLWHGRPHRMSGPATRGISGLNAPPAAAQLNAPIAIVATDMLRPHRPLLDFAGPRSPVCMA